MFESSGEKIKSKYPPMYKSFVGKSKPYRDQRKGHAKALPVSGQRHVGSFNGRAIEVKDLTAIRELHENGCFGIGSISKTTPQFLKKDGNLANPETLLLFPEEAFFLSCSLNCLEIRRKNGDAMTNDECLQEFSRVHPNFISSFVAYTYLRSKNWVIKSGIKFGGDFLAYRRGPEYFHASYLVLVRPESHKPVDPVQLQSIHRVNHNSGKEVLFLEVSPSPLDASSDADTRAEYLKSQFSCFLVTEVVPTRFILK